MRWRTDSVRLSFGVWAVRATGAMAIGEFLVNGVAGGVSFWYVGSIGFAFGLSIGTASFFSKQGISVTFGEALKHFRGNVSQGKLAKMVGIAQPTISQVERGDRQSLSVETVAAIERALDLADGTLVKHLPEGHRAHDLQGATIPNYGLVWGSPPRDVPEPEPGQVYHLVGRFPPGTFALTVSGHSVHRYGVHDGDTIAVRPTEDPEEGALVVARVGNAYTLKACIEGELLSFGRDDDTPKKLELNEPCQVVGVMVGVIDGERRVVPRSKARAKPKPKK